MRAFRDGRLMATLAGEECLDALRGPSRRRRAVGLQDLLRMKASLLTNRLLCADDRLMLLAASLSGSLVSF